MTKDKWCIVLWMTAVTMVENDNPEFRNEMIEECRARLMRDAAAEGYIPCDEIHIEQHYNANTMMYYCTMWCFVDWTVELI